MGEFTKAVWKTVQEAIERVCVEAQEAPAPAELKRTG